MATRVMAPTAIAAACSALFVARGVAATVQILINMTDEACSTCAMGAGAWTVTRERVAMGVRFSWPHLRTGMGVLVASGGQQQTFDRWVSLLHCTACC